MDHLAVLVSRAPAGADPQATPIGSVCDFWPEFLNPEPHGRTIRNHTALGQKIGNSEDAVDTCRLPKG